MLQKIKGESLRILFFSPFAAIDKHERPMLGLKEALENQGHRTAVMRCNETLNQYCIAMSAYGLQFDSPDSLKGRICDRCKKSTRYFDYYFDQEQFFLHEFVTHVDKKILVGYMEDIKESNWWDFHIGKHPVGRIAAYEFFLHNKLNSRNIPDRLWEEYRKHLEYTITIYLAAQNFFSQNPIDRVIVYNRLYSVNKIFCLVAEEFGVVTYTIEASGYVNDFYSRYSAFKEDSTILDLNNSLEWEIARHQPLSALQVDQVKNHFLSLFKAESPWVYSQPKTSKSITEIRKQTCVESNSKVVLLAMSSMDEIFAVDMLGVSSKILLKSKYSTFENQLDWIEHVISIVRDEPTLHLIVRIHPRELPNKREPVSSVHARDILSKLRSQNLPKNVYLNTPDDLLSLYDLFQISDVVLNGNSTSGLEAAFLGIPVVIHHPDLLTTLPQDFAYVAKSRSDYKQILNFALENGKPNVEPPIIYRWYNFRFASISSDFISPNLRRKFIRTSLLYKFYARLQLPLSRILRSLIFRLQKPSYIPNEILDLLTDSKDGINLGNSEVKFGNGEVDSEERAIICSQSELDKIWKHYKSVENL